MPVEYEWSCVNFGHAESQCLTTKVWREKNYNINVSAMREQSTRSEPLENIVEPNNIHGALRSPEKRASAAEELFINDMPGIHHIAHDAQLAQPGALAGSGAQNAHAEFGAQHAHAGAQRVHATSGSISDIETAPVQPYTSACAINSQMDYFILRLPVSHILLM